MIWNKYTIKTTTEAEDYIGNLLLECGITGIEIEDNIPLTPKEKEEMYIDILPTLPKDDGTAFVSFYLEEDQSETKQIEDIKQRLEELEEMINIGEGSIVTSQTKDTDWINNWKQYFKSFTIDDILIKPTWEEEKKDNSYKYMIEIDPKTSFGTGKHETTQLCIRQLRKYMKIADEILDVGCGSGILSILSLKLGASHITGIDVDKECITATKENMEVNGLAESNGTYYHGNLIEDRELKEKIGKEKYQIVVANILADIIIPLTPNIIDSLKKGGYFITSGIIDFKEEEVEKAIIAAGLIVVEIVHQGEWVSITAQKQ